MQKKYWILVIVTVVAGTCGLGLVTADTLDPNTSAEIEYATGENTAPHWTDLNTHSTADVESTKATQSGEFEVHILNVGQADAAVIFSPEGETMVIDSGHWNDDGGTVIEFLEERDVDHIDHLVATHAHADHIGGHAGIIEHFETENDGIGAAYDSGVPATSGTYDEYLDAVEEHDVTLYEVQEGDEIPFDGLGADVYNPPTGDSGDDLHYNSVTILLEHDETSFLFTGDAEKAAEERMAETYGDELEATVFHAGHHGSSTSSHDVFLEAIDTQASVISSGYDSQFGHPDEEVLERFDDHGVCSYWTGTHGTVAYVSDGDEFEVYAQDDGTTDPLDLRTDDETPADPQSSVKKVGSVSPDACSGTTHEETLETSTDTPETLSDHTWTLVDAADDFDGEVETITVDYPSGTSFDGLDNDDITVSLDRDGDGTVEEIGVNAETYDGSEATFTLDGRFNSQVEGEVVVEIDGLDNPPEGEYAPSITLDGDDTHTTEINFFPTEPVTLDIAPDAAETESDHEWTVTDSSDDFDGEIDTITVEYPDEAELDGLDDDDVTVYLDRDGDRTVDEITVNSDTYDGNEATFDLSGAFNTSAEGEVVVEIDGKANPSQGTHTAEITLDGDDTHAETAEYTVA